MAGKTNLTFTNFSAKKLLSKAHTSHAATDNEEIIGSAVQISAQTIFADTVPQSPSKTLNTVQNSSVEYVEFDLSPIAASYFDANSYDDDASAQSAGHHAYYFSLKSSYETDTDNSKAGSGGFENGQHLTGTLGGVQIIPPAFSLDAPNPYQCTIYSGADDVSDQISLTDEIDWYVDYYNGILYVQDYDSGKVPIRAKAFIYVGDMLSTQVGSGASTAEDIGWLGPAAGAISTTGSLFIGTNNAVASDSDIYFGSTGEARFNVQQGASDFSVFSQNRTGIKVDADQDQVLILSGGSGASPDESSFTDVGFFVSGSADSKDGSSRGVALFGGDVVISGTLYDGSGNLIAGSGGGTVTSGSFNVPQPNEFVTTASLSLAGGLGFDYTADTQGNDTFFFVSGTIGSKDSTVKGTSVFGGDVHVSGNIHFSHTASFHSDLGGSVNLFAATGMSDSLNFILPENVGTKFQFLQTDGAGSLSFDYADRVHISVRNNSGVDLLAGTPVYITGYNSGGDRAYIAASSASLAATMPAAGLLAEDLLDGSNGHASLMGFLEGVDTSLFTVGNTIYVSGSGGLTTQKPTGSGDLIQNVGFVLKSASNGIVYVTSPGRTNDVPNDLIGRTGLSGSLQNLADGTSYLIAGDNISIVTGSNGAVTISSSASAFSGGNGEDNQMITADGSGNIVAESNIPFNGSELVVTGSILPGADKQYDLGGPKNRFANIYTGDLHLRNERGHWQIIEEADDLTVVNRLTGKKYKFALLPYEEKE